MNHVKAAFSVISTIVVVNLGVLTPWVGVFVLCMIMDYITGLVAAKHTHTISSKIGIFGIIKKFMYLFVVALSMIIDWMIVEIGGFMGMSNIKPGYIAMLIVIWLIINEIISILENLARFGVKYPEWLLHVMQYFKQTADSKGKEILPK